MSSKLVLAAQQLNEAATNVMESFSTDIGKDDYSKWLEAIRSEAKERNISLTKRDRFDELAFDMLDDDPKLDAADDPEEIKIKVVNALWHRYHSQNATNKADKALSRGSKQAPKAEENEEGDASEISAVGTKGTVRKFPTIKGVGNSNAGMSRVSNSFGQVISNAYETGMNAGDKADKIKCPYEAGTTRAALWDKSFRRGVEASKLAAKATEEEEFSACADAKREGFLDCAMANQELLPGEEVEFINKFEDGSPEGDAYAEGWSECEMTLAAMCGEIDADGDTEFEDDDEDSLEQDRLNQAPPAFKRMTMEP